MSAGIQKIVYDHFEKNGWFDEAKRETALEMLKDGISCEKIARYMQMPLERVQSMRGRFYML